MQNPFFIFSKRGGEEKIRYHIAGGMFISDDYTFWTYIRAI